MQGEDLGRWATAYRLGRGSLTPVQQWLLENILGLTPAGKTSSP
ncbi:hypothetical protein [Streptomyces albireticuli]|nr:hypothetical protein [Streptomyces albireticuli]